MTRSKKLAIVAVAALVVGLMTPEAARAANTASIAGTVRIAGTGDPVVGVWVGVARRQTRTVFGRRVQVPIFLADAVTDAAGHYVVGGLPASGSDGFWVCFSPADLPSSEYEPQCYANQPGFDPYPNPLGWLQVSYGSNKVRVGAGQHIKDIDASFFRNLLLPDPGPTGTVTGTVTDTLGLPLASVKVSAWNNSGRIVGNAATRANGTYRLEHLPTGTYAICFDGSNATGGLSLHAFGNRCYHAAAWAGSTALPPSTAKYVGVVDGATTTRIGAKLPASLT
jgi:hypothetical protein